jgi:hypothetical protein
VTAAMDTVLRHACSSASAQVSRDKSRQNATHTAILVLEEQVPRVIETTGDIAHDDGAGTRGFRSRRGKELG